MYILILQHSAHKDVQVVACFVVM